MLDLSNARHFIISAANSPPPTDPICLSAAGIS
jgi:hypothetical protein